MEYQFALPIIGTVQVSVEAESPEEALKKIEEGAGTLSEAEWEIMKFDSVENEDVGG